MDVNTFMSDGVTVFQIAGEVNINTSHELKKLFEKYSLKKAVVDLEKTSYLDSSGLATLVEALKRAKTEGGALSLCGMSDKVRSLFEITKLDKFFLISATQKDAIEKIK